MATVPYSGAGPDVTPDTRTPDDYTRLDVNPDQFGAAIGKGLDQLGQGVQTAQKFWGQVQTDKSMNDTLAQGDAIVSQFKSLRGSDALNAQQATQDKLNQVIAAGRANLSTPEQQLQFDQQVRPYQQRYWAGQMSTYANEQGRDVATSVNNDAYRLAVSRASNIADDPEEIKHAWADAYSARVKQLQSEGLANPDALTDARSQSARDVFKTAAAAIAVKDPARAQQFVENNKTLLGPEYAPLADGLRARADQQGGANLFKTSLQATQPTAPTGPLSNAPLPPVRGDGGQAPATSISDSTALAAQNRLSSGAGTDADRATLETYRQQQNAPAGAPPASATPSANMPTPYQLAGARSRVAVGKGDAEDKAWIAAADGPGGSTSVPAAAGPEVTGRTPSATPVAAQRLPANPIVDPSDRSHSLPPPTPNGAALPYFSQAGAPYGISGNYLARTWQIESGGRTNPGTSSAGAQGAFQFIPSTWARYGNGGNPTDFGASTAAAVRLGADNRASLTKSLGRAPSDAELYLAHQQGAGGAAKLLANPNARAGDLVGDSAIRSNGGDPNAPAAAFTQLWANKFNGTKNTGPLPMFASSPGFAPGGYAAPVDPTAPPVIPESIASHVSTPQAEASEPTLMQQAAPTTQVPPPAPVEQEQPQRSPEADVYARIEASDASDQVKAHAFAQAKQFFAEQAEADQTNQKAKKDVSEKARDGYVQRLLLGDTSGLLQQVARDPRLEPEARWTLGQAIQKNVEDVNGGNPKTWGPGFGSAYQRLMADPSDANRISSAEQIYHMVGPDGGLTLAGASKLDGVRKNLEHSVDTAAVERVKKGQLDYAHTQLSVEQDFGIGAKMRDPKGEAIFNSEFLPKFEGAVDRAIKAGKDPYEFLNRDFTDNLLKGMRSKADMAAARLSGGEGLEGGPDPSIQSAAAPPAAPPAPPPEPPPPAPTGYNPQGWNAVVAEPPGTVKGPPMSMADWTRAVTTLADDPTAARIEQWNTSKYGKAGYDAGTILRSIRPDKAPPVPLPPTGAPHGASA